MAIFVIVYCKVLLGALVMQMRWSCETLKVLIFDCNKCYQLHVANEINKLVFLARNSLTCMF